LEKANQKTKNRKKKKKQNYPGGRGVTRGTAGRQQGGKKLLVPRGKKSPTKKELAKRKLKKRQKGSGHLF